MVADSRSFRKRRYVLAGVLTFLIFSLGLILGLVIEGKRVEFSQHRITEQRLDLSSLQLQYAYIDQLTQEKNCDALKVGFTENVDVLEESRVRLENYRQSSSVNRAEFEFIRRDYILAQFNYWLLAKRYNQICDAPVATILFFYDDEERCDRCNDQGFVLSHLKNVFDEQLLNFAIYGKYEKEPMVSIVGKTYDIDSYPTLVIDDEKIEGFVDIDRLKEIICSKLDGSHEACST